MGCVLGYCHAEIGRRVSDVVNSTLRSYDAYHFDDFEFKTGRDSQVLFVGNERYPAEAIHKGRSLRHARG